jgi:hypothetical protein
VGELVGPVGGKVVIVEGDVVEGVELGGDPEEDELICGGTTQEQAEDIRDTMLWHWETKVGNPVVSV